MRLRNDPNAIKILEANPNFYISTPKNNKGKWKKVFSNNNPIEIEIGMGKGSFIMNKCTQNPNINYIGIEKNIVICSKAIKKFNALEEELPNLRIINIDATIINEIFSENEISKIYLNFSDPWPKARHAKNRLTNPKFLNLYKEIMEKNGLIEMKTDNDSLYAYTINDVLKENPKSYKIIYQTDNLHKELNNNFNINNIITEYEARFSSEGKN